ncbi:hypothetical protein EMCG_00805 [[Emmonsia] crescens]|uniref:Uncharacterized protein n=1 Tax=[Emmonsia] crescens TaxID=73230 RepID=A0A0G2HQN2_9EURO|nr:hypothetical protein EMCG_00805 [Emmonsia crescens UAMH 3008]
MRTFVKTGGEFDPAIDELYVMVDVILRGKSEVLRMAIVSCTDEKQPGALGAPDNPQAASEVVSIQTHLGTKSFPVLDIVNIMSSKLGAFFGRGSLNDFGDLIFLVENFAEKIYNVRTQLNQNHRQVFVNMYAQRDKGLGSDNRIRKFKFTLGVA